MAGGLACLVLLVGVRLRAVEEPAEAAPRRVLLLHAAGDPGPFRGKFDLAFADAMRTADAPIELYEEAIEVARFPGSEQSRIVREYLSDKYADRKIDVIVTIGIGPLNFARENRPKFGGPPIVAMVSPTGQLDVRQNNVTGLQGGFFINGTIDLALALRPDTQTVFVVDGGRENSGALQAEFERQLGQRSPGVKLEYLRDLSLDDLLARVRAIPPRSMVLFVRQTIRTRTQNIDRFEALEQVVQASPVPVFSHLEEYLGRGIVGGYMWRFETDARRMAQMASLIANGEDLRDVPPGLATYTTMVDDRQMLRWQIPESRLPPGSLILFKTSSFIERYRAYLVGGMLFLAAQLALIAGLLFQRSRRKDAETEARSHAQRYRSVVETQSELICRFLPDTTITFVNDAYCRFWNKTRHELLGRKFIELIPESARDEVLARCARLAQVQGIDSHEHPVWLADGTIGWHHWINHAIVENGRLVELQGVGRDVTDRRRAEEALSQAETRNSAMLRAVPDLMFVFDQDGTYIDYHAKDPALLWAPPELFIGRRVRDIMPPDLRDVFMDALERAAETDDTIVVEYELLLPQLGELRHFEARIVRAGSGWFLSMVRDVTESKRALDLNRALAGRLIVSQEAERQRIARELHDDLSQKVALLNIEIDQVARQVPAPESRVRLQQISARAGEIASDMHNLSHELHPAKLQTLGLVAAIQSLCRDMSEQGRLRVAFTHGVMPAETNPDVSLCLYRIAQEALRNVVRHSQTFDAQVRLICEDGSMSLQIADSGVGFDPQDARGVGLGLHSMRERAALLGGQLIIHAFPGRGTRIWAHVPVRPVVTEPAHVMHQSA
jgi:PAS domain S-box-containing protein